MEINRLVYLQKFDIFTQKAFDVKWVKKGREHLVVV